MTPSKKSSNNAPIGVKKSNKKPIKKIVKGPTKLEKVL